MAKKKGFRINGTVQDFNTGKGIPGLTVKVYDKDLIFDDLLGAAETDEDGHFEIHYDKEDFKELFFDKKPDLYLKIINQTGDLIYTSKDKVRYGAGKTEKFNIKIKNLIQRRFAMNRHFVRIPEKAWKIIKGSEVMYLTDMWFTEVLVDKYVNLVQAEPTEKFYEFIANNMNAVLEGKPIADEIEPVIMNLIDDRMNKRKMALRTGDYIVLQRHFTKQGKKK